MRSLSLLAAYDFNYFRFNGLPYRIQIDCQRRWWFQHLSWLKKCITTQWFRFSWSLSAFSLLRCSRRERILCIRIHCNHSSCSSWDCSGYWCFARGIYRRKSKGCQIWGIMIYLNLIFSSYQSWPVQYRCLMHCLYFEVGNNSTDNKPRMIQGIVECLELWLLS